MPVDLRTCRSNITSQSGENGIIAAILAEIGAANRFCVEFGGYDAVKYSNVNPLWTREGFTAVLIEGDAAVAGRVRSQVDELARSGAVTPPGRAVVISRWVQPTGPDSLDAILAEVAGTGTAVPREPDVVSIDIDSLDHDVWAGLKDHRPRIVVIEHNPSIPPHLSVIGRAGTPRVGASARAHSDLARTKGYTLVACTTFNCFFVPDEFAARFADAGNLGAHFEPSHLVYVCRDFSGGMFYSARLPPAYSLRKDELAALGNPLFAPPPSELAGLFRHPKVVLRRALKRLSGG
ncbi:MAG: hypothetical protein ACKVS8_03895 [Phycisphaerales bacterium]